MADLKREYVVPLRRKIRTAPKWRRSKKAVSVLKEFMRKHMKADDVIICAELNEHIWKNGAKNPPGKISVAAMRTDVAGEQRTLVNLVDIGVEKQLEQYRAQVAGPAAAADAKADKESLEDAVQDAEVKEKPATKKKEATKDADLLKIPTKEELGRATKEQQEAHKKKKEVKKNNDNT